MKYSPWNMNVGYAESGVTPTWRGCVVGLPERRPKSALPVPIADRLPAPRGASAVANRSLSAPVHAGNGLPLAPNPLRDECWTDFERRAPKLVRRIDALTGELLDWYACLDPEAGDGRSKAVVIGTKGMCVAEPRLDVGSKPVYSFSYYIFDPSSHITIPIEYAPMTAGPGKSSASHTLARHIEQAQIVGLTTRGKSQMGNLPISAQRFLQTPFLRGDAVLREICHYEGFPTRMDLFLMALAGSKTVTFVTGKNFRPANSAERNWSLLAHRLTVTHRVGA